MKKRYIKKIATLLWAGNKDPDCKCFDRRMERHKLYFLKNFWHFCYNANKKDWYWYYYYQGTAIFSESHKEAIEMANKCIKDYDRNWRYKNVRR